MKKISLPAMIVFDHDGTLVDTETPDFKLFPGIKEVLVELKASGFDMAVWTARSQKSAQESLKRLEIAAYFTEIFGHDNGPAKPHPMGLEKMTFGYSKSQILHIGDSIADLDGALSFGIEVIAACWNSRNQVEIFQRKTPHIAMTPEDCLPVIAAKYKI